jgi:hypothetical protein
LQWWIPSIGLTSSGQFLCVKGIERISEPRDTWDAYVLGRMGIIPPIKIASLDATEMYAVVEAAELIGRAEESGWRARWPRAPKRHSDERRAALARGFQVLRREEEGIREFLDRYLRHASHFQPSGRRLRIEDLYGWLARASSAQVSGSPVQTLIRQTMSIFAAERGIFDHKRKRKMIANVNCPLTLKEMASKLQVSRHTLRRVVNKLGLSGIKSYRNVQLFSPSDIDIVRSTFDSLIPRKTAAEMLGLTIKEFGLLIESGIIVPFVRICGHTLMNDRFLLSDLETLIKPDVPATVFRSPEAGIPLLVYCKILKQSVAEVIQQIRAGTIKPVSWDKDATGFNRYLLPKPALSFWRERFYRPRGRQSASGLAFLDVAASLGVEPIAVRALISSGYLSLAKKSASNGRNGIDFDSFHEFRETFAPAASYAPSLGCHVNWAHRRLQALGIELLRQGDKVIPGSFVRRSEVRRVLGENCETSNLDSNEIWGGLKDYLSAETSNRWMVRVYSRSKVKVTSSDAVCRAHLTCSENILRIEIHSNRIQSARLFQILSIQLSELQTQWPEATIVDDSRCGEIRVFEEIKLQSVNQGDVRHLGYPWIGDRLKRIRGLLSAAVLSWPALQQEQQHSVAQPPIVG